MNITPIKNEDVLMLDSYCVNALDKEIDYLISFDVDKLLAGFRDTAGLDTKGVTRYEGWENMLIGGHTMGHYLTAMAQAYVNPGVSDSDKKTIMNILEECIDGMLECQRNSKGKPGFLFSAAILDRENVEIQFDNIEKNKTNIITEAWVPWYTMHKILAGVVDVYKFTEYANALTLAKGIGDWTYERASSWSKETRTTVLNIEFGGMNDALYELYAVSGEDKYRIAGNLFDPDWLYEKVATNDTDVITNLHANTTIPKFIGALNRYITSGKKEEKYLEYAKIFWDMVVERHTYITGGNSEWEHFGSDYVLDAERTNCNNETCNIYNMLKLSRMLFSVTGDKKYADYYENAFYNSILSSQNPKTGMTTYFQPMSTGYFKVYGERFNKFWCCTGSGMENFTKLNDSIYFQDGDDIFVNLFFTSKLNINGQNIVVEQEADFPVNDTVSFKINSSDEAANMNLKIRIPDWTNESSVALTINKKATKPNIENGYIKIEGPFNNDDVIAVTFKMNITAHPLPDNNSSIGFKYGPVVLSANLGTKDMVTGTTGVNVTIPAAKLTINETFKLPDGVSREAFISNINDYLKLNDNGVSFSFKGIENCDLEFTPHFTRYEERYGIYWYFKTPEEIEAQRQLEADRKYEILDTVQPGYGQYENDEFHNMQETNTVGVTNYGTFRYALAGGHFTYNMKVDNSCENFLSFTLKAEDNGKTIKVTSGENIIFEDTLNYSGTENSYKVTLPLSDKILSAAKNNVISITFESSDNNESAKICDFIYTLK